MVYALLCHALQIWQLYSSAQNEKETENRLFVQIKSGGILYSLWAFLIKRFTHLVGYRPSHIQPSASGIIVEY